MAGVFLTLCNSALRTAAPPPRGTGGTADGVRGLKGAPVRPCAGLTRAASARRVPVRLGLSPARAAELA